jgi:hypothetical protein
MDEKLFDKFVKEYQEDLTSKKGNGGVDELKERADRVVYYQKFKKDFVDMDVSKFTDFIGNLWASRVWSNKDYLINQMIDSNGSLEKLLQRLYSFLYEEGDMAKKWDSFIKQTRYLGQSYMSELLSYVDPEEYAVYNRQVIAAFNYLGIMKLPVSGQISGALYVQVCQKEKEIQKILISKGVECENLLAVDYFFWEVAKSDEVLKQGKIDGTKENPGVPSPKAKSEENEYKFVHQDIIDKIVDIGTQLGFQASGQPKDCKVAKGAVVDAVWHVRLGNLGRVTYVFEVQSHGSIDSLILNLQKASKNRAVQACIAVSDDKQLEQIAEESLDIPGVKIIPWNYIDVINVHDHLTKAFESLNTLGLIPDSFDANN